MSDFIFVTILTCVTGLISFTIFILCVKQAPTESNFKIEDIFTQLNALRRRLSVIWNRNKAAAFFMGLLTLWMYYINLKRRNFIGTVDALIVHSLVLLLIAMGTIGIPDIIHEAIKYIQSNK